MSAWVANGEAAIYGARHRTPRPARHLRPAPRPLAQAAILFAASAQRDLPAGPGRD